MFAADDGLISETWSRNERMPVHRLATGFVEIGFDMLCIDHSPSSPFSEFFPPLNPTAYKEILVVKYNSPPVLIPRVKFT